MVYSFLFVMFVASVLSMSSGFLENNYGLFFAGLIGAVVSPAALHYWCKPVKRKRSFAARYWDDVPEWAGIEQRSLIPDCTWKGVTNTLQGSQEMKENKVGLWLLGPQGWQLYGSGSIETTARVEKYIAEWKPIKSYIGPLNAPPDATEAELTAA